MFRGKAGTSSAKGLEWLHQTSGHLRRTCLNPLSRRRSQTERLIEALPKLHESVRNRELGKDARMPIAGASQINQPWHALSVGVVGPPRERGLSFLVKDIFWQPREIRPNPCLRRWSQSEIGPAAINASGWPLARAHSTRSASGIVAMQMGFSSRR